MDDAKRILRRWYGNIIPKSRATVKESKWTKINTAYINGEKFSFRLLH